MRPDVRAFQSACIVDVVVLLASVTCWFLLIRPIRRDKFAPNPIPTAPSTNVGEHEGTATDAVSSNNNNNNGVVSPPHEGRITDEDPLAGKRSLNVMVEMFLSRVRQSVSDFSWFKTLTTWPIEDFQSSDAYLYLLCLRVAAYLFMALGCADILIILPVYLTAPRTYDESSYSFLEQSVISVLRPHDWWRLWVVYLFTWIFAFLALVATITYWSQVNYPGTLGSSLLDKSSHTSPGGSRFYPNHYTIMISGIDHKMTDPTPIYAAVTQFVPEHDIVAIHLVYDFSEALKADRILKKYLNKLVIAQHKQKERMYGKQPAEGCSIEAEGAGPLYSGEELQDSNVPHQLVDRWSPRAASDAGDLPHFKSSYELNFGSVGEYVMSQFKKSLRNDDREGCTDRMFGEDNEEEDDVDAILRRISTTSWTQQYLDFKPGWDSSNSGMAVARGNIIIPDPVSPLSDNKSGGWGNRNDPGTRSPFRSTCSRLSTIMESYSRGVTLAGLQLPKEISRIQHKIEVLEAKVISQWSLMDRIKEKSPQHNVGKAFVTFRSPACVKFFLTHNLYSPLCPDCHCAFHKTNNILSDVQGECLECGAALSHDDPEPASTAPTVQPIFGGGPVKGLPYTADDLAAPLKLSESPTCCGNIKQWNRRWEVSPAPPPENIVWENIHIGAFTRIVRTWTYNILIFITAFLLTSSAMFTDAFIPLAQHIESFVNRSMLVNISLSGWAAPLLLYLVNAQLLPFLVRTAANSVGYWKESSREKATLKGNIWFMFLSTIVFPLIGSTSIETAILYFFFKNKIKDLNISLGQLIVGASASFVLRYLLNSAFVNFSTQLMQLPMFIQGILMRRVIGSKPMPPNKFDFGYWYAFSLSMYMMVLIFSIDIPFVPFCGFLFFWFKYWVDKYNFSFSVWSSKSESAGAVASSVVTHLLLTIFLFQFIMSGYFIAIGLRGMAPSADLSRSMSDDMSPNDLIFTNSTNVPVIRSSDSSRRSLRMFTVAGTFLLLSSIVFFILAIGQSATRAMSDRSRLGLMRFVVPIWIRLIKLLERLNIMTPTLTEALLPKEKIKYEEASLPILTQSELKMLEVAYQHPCMRYKEQPCSSPLS